MGIGKIGEYAENLIGIEAKKMVGRAGITRSGIEDLRQDLRLHLWRRLPMFGPRRAKYETFVDRIVRHRAATIVEFRKAARRSRLRCQCSLNEGIKRFLRDGPAGLHDAPRSGRPPVFSPPPAWPSIWSRWRASGRMTAACP
jgi:DNA-directed RNA polymerase specialized sigma24 family protein